MTPEEQKSEDARIRAEADASGVRGTLEAINNSLESVQGSLKESNTHSEDLAKRVAAIEDKVRTNNGIGLTDAETKKFSLSRALNGIKFNEWHGADFEREAMDAAATKRSQNTASNAAGGFLLPDEVSTRIIEPLKAMAVAGAAGATILEGLSGTVHLPKAATAELQSRTDGAAVSDQSANWTYSEVTLTGTYSGELVKVSRDLLKQGVPSVDAFIERQLFKAALRRVDVIALAEISALTATADTIAANVAGNAITPAQLQRAVTLLQNANVMDASTVPGLVANPLVKYHLLKPSAFTAAIPGLSYAGDKWLAEMLGGKVLNTTIFGDDTGILGEMCYGAWENLIIGLFGEGIEVASSEHSSFGSNLIDFRVLLAADAVVVQNEAFIYWDDLGDA